MDYQFLETSFMNWTFWFSWVATQFSLLHQGLLKFFFSFMGDSAYMWTMDNEENFIIPQGETEYHNWFNYDNRTKNIYPLYSYYSTDITYHKHLHLVRLV